MRKRKLTLTEQYALVVAHIQSKKNNARVKSLPETLELAIGAKVMLT